MKQHNVYHPLLPSICVGYYMEKVPQILMNGLNKQIEDIQNNFSTTDTYNKYLVGHIQHEYALIPSNDLLNFVLKTCNTYNDLSAKHPSNAVQNYFLSQVRVSENILAEENAHNWDVSTGKDFWVNFQSKYEYNPPHVHSGIFSFVIWSKIPYKREDEEQMYPSIDKNINKNGCFTFYHMENGTLIETLFYLDSQYENTICVFPSILNHAVFPFYTSDEYRISVSGNIYLKSGN